MCWFVFFVCFCLGVSFRWKPHQCMEARNAELLKVSEQQQQLGQSGVISAQAEVPGGHTGNLAYF